MAHRFTTSAETAHMLTKTSKKENFYFRTLTRTDHIDKVECETTEPGFKYINENGIPVTWIATKYEFFVRQADHTESTLATTIDDDMSEEQVRRECKNLLGTWQGDCPVGVDVYRNGDYFTSVDVED